MSYDVDNWKSAMGTPQGAEDPKYTKRQAYSVEEIVDIHLDFQPDPTDEVYLSERKDEIYKETSELIALLESTLETGSFSHDGIKKSRNGVTYLNTDAINALYDYLGLDCPKKFRSKTKKVRLKPQSIKSLSDEEQIILNAAREMIAGLSHETKQKHKRKTGFDRRYLAGQLKTSLTTSYNDATIRKLVGRYPEYWDSFHKYYKATR